MSEQGPAPGNAGAWKPGTVPPGARALLHSLGINPDDATAVRTYYEARYNGVEASRPYWYAEWLQRHPAS